MAIFGLTNVFQNLYNNIFGTIATGNTLLATGKDFLPVDANGNYITITGQDAVWLGLGSKNMQYWTYLFCSPLAGIVDRLAEADINGEITIVKGDKSDEISNSQASKRINTLLMRPNPLQTWEQFRGEQVVLKKIFGYCPVWAWTPAGFDRSYSKYLWNLNPYYANPTYNTSFSLTDIGSTRILEWVVNIQGKVYNIPAYDVMILKDGYIDNLQQNQALPLSKIAGLDWAVSNILAAMEADNVLLKKKGPLGFISNDMKSDQIAGTPPLAQEEKDELQKSLTGYGMSWNQFQYVISRFPVKWNPMSFNLKDLMTKETARQGIDMICDRFAYPPELMSGKNATYENRSSAEKFLYNSNVIPASLRDLREYNNYLDCNDYGISIKAYFDELPIMQEDLKQAGEANKYNTEAWLMRFQTSMITLNQFRIYCGDPVVAGDDIFFDEYLKKYNVQAVKTTPPTNTAAS